MIKTFAEGFFALAAGLVLVAIRAAGAETNFPPHVGPHKDIVGTWAKVARASSPSNSR